MRSILQNVHCSQGRLLTQQKRSSHRLTKLTLQKRNKHGPEEGNFDPTTQMRFRPNLKSRQHTASRLGTTAVTPACISFNSPCTWENGSWGKQYFRKLSPMVAQGTHYIIARVLLRHLKKKIGNKFFLQSASRKPYRSRIMTEILSIGKDIK